MYNLNFKNLATLPRETQKFKNVAIALSIIDDKSVNTTNLKKFQHLKKYLSFLLIYCFFILNILCK